MAPKLSLEADIDQAALGGGSGRPRHAPWARATAVSLVGISQKLSQKAGRLEFKPPVEFVYNPLEYARAPHEAYLETFGRGSKEILFLGMNPGPFGMAQTGVPFGDVKCVRDFLGISRVVGRPPLEHPKRPVLGFECTRGEVSGQRLWGWVARKFEKPEAFFARCFVANYCPLAFIESTGKNRTPDKLPADERLPLLAACDEALRAMVDELTPTWVIGIGAFAKNQAERALCGGEAKVRNVKVGTILHPSPQSPLANRGWSEVVERQLGEMGISW